MTSQWICSNRQVTPLEAPSLKHRNKITSTSAGAAATLALSNDNCQPHYSSIFVAVSYLFDKKDELGDSDVFFKLRREDGATWQVCPQAQELRFPGRLK
ncbi:hypothetical protein BV898_13537 [Hypsibius exemplaris]|uniref:Uncharacterized protein n=1 Tax=Hypsibius exemplaris TaxID=2072580 RepID=A0A1W0WAF4_HYPEX|nr:hypothetical protein BV898_13537 [Hypsibius exemplaris]